MRNTWPDDAVNVGWSAGSDENIPMDVFHDQCSLARSTWTSFMHISRPGLKNYGHFLQYDLYLIFYSYACPWRNFSFALSTHRDLLVRHRSVQVHSAIMVSVTCKYLTWLRIAICARVEGTSNLRSSSGVPGHSTSGICLGSLFRVFVSLMLLLQGPHPGFLFKGIWKVICRPWLFGQDHITITQDRRKAVQQSFWFWISLTRLGNCSFTV